MSSGTRVNSRIDEFRAAVASRIDAEAWAEGFAVDGALPAVVVEPRSEADVASVLAEAQAAGLSIVAVGAGQHLTIGNPPERYDVALSMRRLNRVIAHEPADLTVTVEAGTSFGDLGLTLSPHNQFLPVDPPGGGATVGGLVAANLSGPLRHAYGTIRDWLIGVRVAHADGRISKAGGRVVKNVTGYEMTKLYTGSLGTLGVVTEATFKLAPLPPVRCTVVCTTHSAHAASTLLFAARDAGLSLEAAELLSPPAAFAVLGEARWSVLMRLGGVRGGVDRTMRELGTYANGLGGAADEVRDDAWERWYTAFALERLSLRVSVSPTSVPEVVEVLDRRFAGAAAMLSATAGVGVIRAKLSPSAEERAGALVDHARELVSAHGGSVVVEAAPPSYKREHDVFSPLRADFAIMKRLKDEFDPKRTLSPGRFVGRL